jgi:PAS domain S-box-containing protein
MANVDRLRKLDVSRLAQLLEASNDGFWDWNVQTGEVFFGGRWGAMLGYEAEELEPHVRTWEKLVHPDDLAWVTELLTAHLEGRTDHYQAEHRLRAKDGSWRWILDRGRVVERDADGRPLRACGAHVDVTERKVVELEKERIAQDREQLIGMVSHELKNPMQLILSSVDAIERASGRPDAARIAARSVAHVRRALARMNRLVADLLDTTRLEGGRLPLRRARWWSKARTASC